MKRFYEIIRLDNQGFDQDCFEEVRRLVKRGWLRKAVEYLAQWDNGGENIDTAEYLERVWDSPSDPREKSDSVIYEMNGYHLCHSDPSRNGGYEAFYLMAELEA